MPDVALRGLSPALHQALKRAADQNHRSLNGEILARLETSLGTSTVDVDVLFARIEARRQRLGSLTMDEDELGKLKQDGRS